MPVAVVELLEVVEIRHDEAEGAAVTHRPRDLALEAVDERAPVEEPREWVVVGEEAKLAEMPARHERGGGVVGEDPQSLEAVGRRHEPVGRVVDPDDPEQRAPAVRTAARSASDGSTPTGRGR